MKQETAWTPRVLALQLQRLMPARVLSQLDFVEEWMQSITFQKVFFFLQKKANDTA